MSKSANNTNYGIAKPTKNHAQWIILGVILVGFIALLILWVLRPDQSPALVGFTVQSDVGGSKTLWDWLGLFLVPLSLLGAVWWWIYALRKIEHNKVTTRLHHKTVRSFLDRLTDLNAGARS